MRLTINTLSFKQENSRALTKASNQDHSSSFNPKWVFFPSEAKTIMLLSELKD